MKMPHLFKRQSVLKRRENIFGYVFTLPWILGFVFLSMVPFFYSLFLSFNQARYTGLGLKVEWVGWDNYQQIIFDPNGNFVTLSFEFFTQSLFMIPMIVIIAFLLALLVNRQLPGRTIFRILYFFPVIISSGEIFRQIQTYGQMETFVSRDTLESIFFGLAPFWLLNSIFYALTQLTAILWYAGVPMLIFLAALQKRDISLYEAAKIDGATAWESFWKITVPMIMPMFTINILYVTIYLGTVEHNQIIRTITSSSLYGAGYGYGAAMAWLYAVVLLLMIGLFASLFRSRYSMK